MNQSTYQRSHELLSPATSLLLTIDMQEKLAPIVVDAEKVIANCGLLCKAAEILGVTQRITEQYPKGLGPTIPELAEYDNEPQEKLRFSGAEAVHDIVAASATGENQISQIVIAGIETHVCVAQTALDFVSTGMRVYLAADATSSRFEEDKAHALNRLRDSGVVVTTTEAIMFEWCEVAGTDEFKQISRLVKNR